MLKKTLNITVLADCATLFNVLFSNGTTTEIAEYNAVRESYKDGIIYDMIWIRRKLTNVGAIREPKILLEFVEAVYDAKPHYEVEQWITRILVIVWTMTTVD